MKSLKKFIKKVYAGETEKTRAFCEKEKQIYTVKKVETKDIGFIFVSEKARTDEVLKYVVAYNDFYFAFVYSEGFFIHLDGTKIFEDFGLEKLSYDEFLAELQEVKDINLDLDDLLNNGDFN